MRRARGERGQILPIVALALVALLGISAFAIDVGYAYYAKRQLQSATDAAALAGAQDLPIDRHGDGDGDHVRGRQHAREPLRRATSRTRRSARPRPQLAGSARRRPTRTRSPSPGTASTNTWFAKIFGIDEVRRHRARPTPAARARRPRRRRRRARPHGLDVPRPEDRDDCTDLDNAKDGVHTLLSILNPPYAQVGMIAFPPLDDGDARPCCDAPQGTSSDYTAYDSANRGYLTDQISSDYKLSNGSLNTSVGSLPAHRRGRRHQCVRPDGYTSYSEALRQAEAGARRARARQHPRRHRLPDRRRGQHRQRVRSTARAYTDGRRAPSRRTAPRPSPTTVGLPARQRRRPAALPDRDRPRRRHTRTRA